MKKLIFLLQLALLAFTSNAQQKRTAVKDPPKSNTEGHCATDGLHTKLLNQSSSYSKNFNEMNARWQTYALEKDPVGNKVKGGNNTTQTYTQTTLPVIFHMMVNTTASSLDPNASSTDGNLTKTQIQTALGVLNQIYSGTTTGSKPAGLNTNIQFCLAEVDNYGNAITSYTYTDPSFSLTLDNTNQPQITALSNVVQSTGKFPTTKYINIYVVEDIASPVAGFAYMPPAHGSSFDGIYIEAQYLLDPGTPNDLPYNMTVLSHEMGHYLGLFHTFGICTNLFYACSCTNNNCLFDGDMVCDTPPDFSQAPIANCTITMNTCPTDVAATGDGLNLTSDVNDLTDNYMDYGNWTCQYLFTVGQRKRMHFMIDDQVGPRNSLLYSSVCNSVCANSACTVAIDPITTTSVNSVQLLNSLILSGPSVNYTFTGTPCNAFYNTFNWSVLDATSNAVLTSGSGLTYPATFTATGNYKIVLTSSINGSDPLCSQSATLLIQVLPPASCPENLDMTGGWNMGNWERIYYEGGWSHTTNNSATFTHPTTTLTVLPGTAPNGTLYSDPFSFTNTVASDPNFTGASAVPFAGATVMRVGRLITPTTVLPAGDASYVTYTFNPTNSNAKIRIWYLGLKEHDAVSPIGYDYQFGSNAGAKSGFGWVCNYEFTSVNTPTYLVTRGTTHTGVSNYGMFRNNDMVTDAINSPTTTPLTIGSTTFDAMTSWKYMDLDFSEFVCGAPTVTITFFARADEANTPGILHSYAYFAAQCMPGLYKDVDISLVNKDIACMANVGQSCVSQELPAPNSLSYYSNGYNYIGFLDIKVDESNDGITYTPTGIPYTLQYNPTLNQMVPVLNLCKSPDTNPYKYFKITWKNLCQTITNTVSIFQGFVHTIDDCAPDPMSGGHFTATPVVSGSYTYNPDQYVQICNSATLSLGRPCWLSVSDPDPDYQWEVNSGGWYAISGATMATYPMTNTPTYWPCTQFRRQAKYSDPYCNTDIWIPSDIFSVTNLQLNYFNYTVSGPDVCGNSLTTFSINNLYDVPNFLCDQELAAETSTNPATNSLTFSFFSNSSCAPGTSLTANTGPSVYTYTFFNSAINYSNTISMAFTFNNVNTYTANGYAYALVQVSRYGCNSSFIIPIPIKIKPSAVAGTIAVSNTVCTNASYTITGDNPNATGYYWEYSYSPTFVPTLTVSAATNSVLPVTPSTFTAFPVYVRRVANGTVVCPNVAYSNTLTIINTAPSVTVTASSFTICAGETVTLTASGASTYTWTNGTATTTANPVILTPSSTKVFTITGTSIYGCTDTQTGTVTVLPSPTLGIEAPTTKLCSGTSATLTGSGATSYTWTGPSFTTTTNPLVITPTVTTTYTLVGSTGSSCTATMTIPITVFASPTVVVSPSSSTICAGSSETLTASGASTYTWYASPTVSTTTNPYIVTPSASNVYTVLGYNPNTGCWGSNTVNITVNPTPTASISGNTVICTECNVFTASGGGTYLWSNGSTNSTVCIGGSGPLSVTVTAANGCTAVATVTTSAGSPPTITAYASPSVICSGNCSTLTAGGVSTVTWTAPSFTSNSNPAVVCPTVTTNYTITGIKGNGPCTNSAVVTVSVGAPTSLTITGTTFLCGSCTTLTVTGASTYTWSTGDNTSTVCIGSPGIYTVSGTNASGCISTKTISIVLGTYPSITANASPNPICPGATTTLTASGGLTYTWTSASASFTSYSNPVTVNPTVTTTYTVFGRGGKYSCISSAVVTVTVLPSPTVSITGWTNGCSSFNTTLTASGGGTYLWNTGATTNTLAVSGIYSTIYTCTVTGVNGCTNVATANIIVNPSNTISVVGNNTICAGQTATLSASGGFSWIWNTGATTSAITTSLSGVYTVTASLGHGCKSIASTSVTVLPNPTVTISGNLVICNNTTILTASGGGTYLWNTGATTNTIAVSVVGVYGVTVTAANGCTATKTVNVVTQHGCVLNGKISSQVGQEPVSQAEPFIFPNPTKQSFSVGNSEAVELVEVFDYTGKLVKVITKENKSFGDIDMRAFDNGVYLIRITTNADKAKLFKLIKE